jgi:hypothetical protein
MSGFILKLNLEDKEHRHDSHFMHFVKKKKHERIKTRFILKSPTVNVSAFFNVSSYSTYLEEKYTIS